MSGYKYRGLTLLELLTVMLIVVALLALALPILHSARYRAGDATCLNNMRQVLMALNMYRSDYHDRFPSGLRHILPYTKTKEIFRCPIDQDTTSGMTLVRHWNQIEELSYYYFMNHTKGEIFLKYASINDPNPGILACIWHPISNLRHRDSSGIPFFAPHVRRGLLDGSVHTVLKRLPTPEEVGAERSYPWGNDCYNGWVLYTNAPCPPEYLRLCEKREGEVIE